jgi:LAGLIDADG endonuclease
VGSGDPVTTDPKGEVPRRTALPSAVAGYNTPALVKTTDTYGGPLESWFVTGLTEGEGCFCISFAVRPKLRTGLEVRPSFSLSLNEKDRSLLRRLQSFFECGWLRESRGDRTVKYEVRAHADLVGRIVPHFEDFPLAGSKARSFDGFSSVCRMVWQGDHLTRSGLRKIVAIAYETSLGKRRHSQADLLRVLDEVKG